MGTSSTQKIPLMVSKPLQSQTSQLPQRGKTRRELPASSSRLFPALPALNAMLVGTFYLAIFVGGIISGWLARFYPVLKPTALWATHAASVEVLLRLHHALHTL